ncbi:adenylate/guanylate cyclase domain-containing protein [Magnetofaba australis]|uniref:Putative adenylate/guanylate cyclase n=1 Tax=Magnetofaba australis IT-1 TaxID=1434232 RepID=A0A1Y2JZR2_9PROT|nr:adenylate/guanylate cyclase domain-containing protein [Magnetofaba australis]OSM00420.1 putative adenylate/guanylate cyclase [Magnetofaba australis IT-1]
MKKLTKRIVDRWDLWLAALLFLLAIPAERLEVFDAVEENLVNSMRQILRQQYGPEEVTSFTDKILLVNTDEAFFKEYGSYPLRRTDIATIASNLRALGAKVVAVDVLMDFPSSYGEDDATAQYLGKAGNILMVSQAQFDENHKYLRLNYPTEKIREVTKSGYTNISSSSALVTSLSRLEIYPRITQDPDGWPFAVQALSMYLGEEPILEGNVLRIGHVRVPLDHHKRFFIDFPKLPNGARFLSEFKGMSAMEFLDLDVEDLDEDERYELELWVRDKIVILGDTSEVSHDWFDTPVGMVYGVEIIADTIHSLMGGAPLRPASFFQEAGVMVLFMILLVLINVGVSHPILRSIGVALLFGVFLAAATWLYVQYGLIVSVTYTMVAGILSLSMINLKSYLAERNQKSMIKDAFGQYLSPKVVEILVKDPSKLSLGGEQREMTAYFSDVAGFSTISEKLTPSELVNLLNEYLTAMCDIIAQHDGTVDKFEGDAIIAFWGAPLDQSDHAVRACLASVEMQQHMTAYRAELVERGQPLLNVRMGLNSGPMVVGNMGSKQRMDYTMMGDAVNLAARLEGANKFFASYTMISEFTYALAKDHIDVRELDTIRVVGKNEPITVYELLDKKGGVTGQQADLMAAFHKAQQLYKGRDFKAAMAAFEKALEIVENDGPSLTYRDRCRDYIDAPPPADWDGVYTLSGKG